MSPKRMIFMARLAMLCVLLFGVSVHGENGPTLPQQENTAKEEKAEALTALRAAEKTLKQETDPTRRALADARASLENVKSQLSGIEIAITRSLEEKNTVRQKAYEELKRQEQKLESPTKDAVAKAYTQVTTIWREVGRRTLDLFSNPDNLVTLPELPPYPESVLTELKDSAEAKAYLASWEHAIGLRKDIVAIQKSLWEAEVNRNYLLLKEVGKLRSQLLLALKERGESSPFALTDEYVDDLKREFVLVPLRWRALFYSKLLSIRAGLTSGIGGVFGLIRQFFSFLSLLIVPFALLFFSRNFRTKLDNYRANLIRRHRRTKGSVRLAVWIQRINPYTTWIVAALATWLADYFLQGTVLEEFRTFLPYVYYYILYRIFLRILEKTFSRFAQRSKVYSKTQVSERLHRTGKYVGTFFLAGVCLLHATESSVGKALVYHLTQTIVFGCGFIVCTIAAYFWREEIESAVPDYFGPNTTKKMQGLFKGPLAIVFSFPILLLLVSAGTLRFLRAQLSQFDFAKRLSAKLFRQKLESVSTDKNEPAKAHHLPEDYLQAFSTDIIEEESLYVEPQKSTFPQILKAIEEWKLDPEEENSVAIFGERGSGKTTILRKLENTVEGIKYITIDIPGGCTDTDDLLNLLREALALPEGADISALYKWDKECEKTLICVDNAHNFFLSAVGGFESYRKFLEIVNLPLKNVFWCASFNLHSWSYLRSVFKKNQYFRHVFSVDKWSDEDIQELILGRHAKTEYKLSYDDIIYATQSTRNYETENHAETQFFRLLWEQSRGNPTSALYFWLSSLRHSHAKNLKVGLPDEPSSKIFQDLSIESLLVYASIIRHENLSVSEMIRTTEVPDGLVRQARKIGVERKFLERLASGRYRVTPGWQYITTNYLINKNLLNAR